MNLYLTLPRKSSFSASLNHLPRVENHYCVESGILWSNHLEHMKFLKCAEDFTFQKLFFCQVCHVIYALGRTAEWECLPRKHHNTGCSSQPLRRYQLQGRWDEGGLVHFLSSAEPPRLSATCRKRTVARAASSFQLPPVKTTWGVTQVLSHFLQTSSSCLAPLPSQHSKTSREKMHIWNICRGTPAVMKKNCQQ